MDLEQARHIIENKLNKKITNLMLAEALGMATSNVSRKASSATPLKTYQKKRLESHFNILLDENNSNNTCLENDNYDNLKELIYIVESYLESEDLYIEPSKKSELIVLLYKMYLNNELSINKTNIISLCKLAS